MVFPLLLAIIDNAAMNNCKHIFIEKCVSNILNIYPGVPLLHHIVILSLEELTNYFPQRLYNFNFTSSLEIYEYSHLSSSSTTPVIFQFIFYYNCSSGCKIVSHCTFKKIFILALAGVAQWTEHQPVKQRAISSIPSQGTYLGCRPGPQLVILKSHPHAVFLPFSLSPFSSV